MKRKIAYFCNEHRDGIVIYMYMRVIFLRPENPRNLSLGLNKKPFSNQLIETGMNSFLTF